MASLTPILLADMHEGAKVLVVDDSAAQRALMSRALASAGYEVVTAADPAVPIM